jgi:putative colanic acid biosynthesis glycosyltransferase
MTGSLKDDPIRCHPFFSIITVVWNNVAGLKQTKETLYQQASGDWEWIIVDGASTDGTREFALSCSGGRVRVISELDRGIYDAMNKGLLLAEGRYVVFLNSGDLLARKDSLAKVKDECILRNPDVLFGSSIMDFGMLRIERAVRRPKYIWHGQPGLHQATLFRREAHVKYLYDLSYSVCGDYDVLTRMASAGLNMQSAPILISVNEYNADAESGRKKIKLIMEAARAQRKNLHLSYVRIAQSALWRATSSLAAKTLTLVDLLKRTIAPVRQRGN